MSFTNHTPNYNLPQYVGTDKPTFLGDFNNAMSAIDTALHNNEQNAGEGLSELQQAQAALTETQETLTEVQTEVANVSGIAATVNQNVQQALTAANDATTVANSATSQIQPAVTAANQASADAQAAQQVANGNVTTLNDLSERVTALEGQTIGEYTVDITQSLYLEIGGHNDIPTANFNVPEGQKIKSIKYYLTGGKSLTSMQLRIIANTDTSLVNIACNKAPQSETEIDIESIPSITVIKISYKPNGQSTSGATTTISAHVLITLEKS